MFASSYWSFETIAACVLSWATVYVITPSVISLARWGGMITDTRTSSHPAHTHSGIIPRAGGLAIYIGILLAALIYLPHAKSIIAILAGGCVLVVTGLLDDRYDLSPYLRLALNIIASLIAISGGLGIPYISSPWGPPISLAYPQYSLTLLGHSMDVWVVADIFAMVWLVSLMNMVNWSKGVDGQLPGYVGIAAIFLAITASRFTAHDLSARETQTLALIVGGAYLGFLPWNFYPQRIMPGYGGGSLAGYMLGVLSILSFGKVGALMIVLSVPLLDGIYTLLRRLKSGKNPFRGDDGHLHHLLLRHGWTRRGISIFYMTVTAVLGACMLFLPGTIVKVTFIALVYLALALWIYRLSQKGSITTSV